MNRPDPHVHLPGVHVHRPDVHAPRPDLDVEVAALAIVGPTMLPTRGLGTDSQGRDLADRVFAVLWPGLAGPDTPAQADRVSE